MLTRNYDNALMGAKIPYSTNSSLSPISSTSEFRDGFLSVKAPSGSIKAVNSGVFTYAVIHRIANTKANNMAGGDTSCNLCVGGYLQNGTPNTPAPESYDDIKMTSVFDTAAVSYPTAEADEDPYYDDENNCFVRTLHKTYKALKAIAINEIALCGSSSSSTSASTMSPVSGTECFVFDRRVLSEPILINANQFFTINYTIKVPANPNKAVTSGFDIE